MTKTQEPKNEKRSRLPVPEIASVKTKNRRTRRVMVPPARLPAELVNEAIEYMNAYTMTMTEWHEHAWRNLIDSIKRRERAAKNKPCPPEYHARLAKKGDTVCGICGKEISL